MAPQIAPQLKKVQDDLETLSDHEEHARLVGEHEKQQKSHKKANAGAVQKIRDDVVALREKIRLRKQTQESAPVLVQPEVCLPCAQPQNSQESAPAPSAPAPSAPASSVVWDCECHGYLYCPSLNPNHPGCKIVRSQYKHLTQDEKLAKFRAAAVVAEHAKNCQDPELKQKLLDKAEKLAHFVKVWKCEYHDTEYCPTLNPGSVCKFVNVTALLAPPSQPFATLNPPRPRSAPPAPEPVVNELAKNVDRDSHNVKKLECSLMQRWAACGRPPVQEDEPFLRVLDTDLIDKDTRPDAPDVKCYSSVHNAQFKKWSSFFFMEDFQTKFVEEIEDRRASMDEVEVYPGDVESWFALWYTDNAMDVDLAPTVPWSEEPPAKRQCRDEEILLEDPPESQIAAEQYFGQVEAALAYMIDAKDVMTMVWPLILQYLGPGFKMLDIIKPTGDLPEELLQTGIVASTPQVLFNGNFEVRLYNAYNDPFDVPMNFVDLLYKAPYPWVMPYDLECSQDDASDLVDRSHAHRRAARAAEIDMFRQVSIAEFQFQFENSPLSAEDLSYLKYRRDLVNGDNAFHTLWCDRICRSFNDRWLDQNGCLQQ